MRFPRFWTTAVTGQIVTWGWSDASADDALRVARERQQRVIAYLAGKDEVQPDDYGYPDRPLREEVIREFPHHEGGTAPTALISRNSLGCLVLNTTELMFVDVDEKEARRSSGGFWSSLFGRPKKPVEPAVNIEERVESQARQWVASNHAWRWRIYRTRAGVRLMAVHAGITTGDPVVPGVFESFGADPLYRRLCREQQSFRARLTPKPWRCGVANPPARWPFRDAEAEAAFRRWDGEYLKTAINFATCRFLMDVGTAPMAHEFGALVSAHDDATQAHHDLPLA